MTDETKAIRVKAIIEIMGSPKEHVEQTLSMIIEKLKEIKEIEMGIEKRKEAQEVEPKPFWNAFTEIELTFANEASLMSFCVDFMPSSIEILEPEDKINLRREGFQEILNDMLGRLHHYDMLLKNLHAQNMMFKRKEEEANKQAAQPKAQEPTVEEKKE